ncbi:DUF3986 family protein [Bacillus paralicheniformis]|uniref:DUF3986 family protein n=1 Tax=Bacillus paralicheniformis TaxID=1648923 RepID=UPI0021A63357|nr:DUF3986 family protein [Bacillus paralicheniformis]UWS63492.1 DUF3986 family protein [Bacillus paralicheniformis]
MNYDETQHLHISYDKNGLDLEAVGLKRLDVDVWDVYFNFQDHAMDEPLGTPPAFVLSQDQTLR